MGGTWDLGTSFEVGIFFLAAKGLLGPCSPGSMTYRLPLLRRCCLDKQSPKSRRGHLSTYQACPRHPRCELFEPLESPFLQSEICLSPPQVMSMKRKSPPLVLLLPQAEPIEVAVRLVEGLLELGNLGLTLQSEPVAGHLLLWRGLFLDITPRWTRSPRSSGRLAIAYPHLQRSRTSTNS